MALLKRIAEFFNQTSHDPGIAALYNRAVDQARRPVFYSEREVPDTIDGRFDLIVLHIFLIMRRMEGEAAAKQELFDLMFADMDRNLREMGVSDMSIGKKVKPMISAFYGRMQAYEKALGEGGDALEQALARNLYGKVTASPATLSAMAGYVKAAAKELETQSVADLKTGIVTFE